MLARIKKGDTVICLSGKDKGKKGKVLSVDPSSGKLIVEKLNIVKRHKKPGKNFQGGIIEKPNPLDNSKVMLICPRCSKPTRVGTKVLEGGKKARACKKCNEIIDKI
jgi:large subunit ribosomal protein L24